MLENIAIGCDASLAMGSRTGLFGGNMVVVNCGLNKSEREKWRAHGLWTEVQV